MFRELRRTDRKMSEAETIDLLINADYGILSTYGLDGYAYGVPLSYTYLNDAIYFHCALDGYKLDNIRTNNKVSFCVVGETEVLADKFSMKYYSVIVFGTIVEVEKEEKERALVGLLEKYSSEHMESGMKYLKNDRDNTVVLKLEVEHITGKARKK